MSKRELIEPHKGDKRMPAGTHEGTSPRVRWMSECPLADRRSKIQNGAKGQGDRGEQKKS